MSAETVLIGAAAAVLVVAALLVLVRIIRGPSVLDRTIASEVLVSIIVCGLGLEAALNRHSTTLPILVSLSLLGFIGSVAIARFVARDHDRGTDEASARNFLGRSGEDGPPQVADRGESSRPLPTAEGEARVVRDEAGGEGRD